jgi:hypothetical protein
MLVCFIRRGKELVKVVCKHFSGSRRQLSKAIQKLKAASEFCTMKERVSSRLHFIGTTKLPREVTLKPRTMWGFCTNMVMAPFKILQKLWNATRKPQTKIMLERDAISECCTKKDQE